jgi:hypothetical protein
MRTKLLLAGGVTQLFVALLHTGIAYGLTRTDQLTVAARQSAQIFNATVLTTVAFLAYVSLAFRHEIASSRLGRALCLFAALLYVQRFVVATALRGIDGVDLVLCAGIATIYLLAAWPERPRAEAA